MGSSSLRLQLKKPVVSSLKTMPLFDRISKIISSNVSDISNNISQAGEAVVETAIGIGEAVANTTVEATQTVVDKVVETKEAVTNTTLQATQTVVDKVVETKEAVTNTTLQATQTVVDKVVETKEAVTNTTLQATQTVVETATVVGGVISEATVQTTQTVVGSIVGATEAISTTVSETGQTIVKIIPQIYQEGCGAVAEELTKIGFTDWHSFVDKCQKELDTNVIKSQDWLYHKIQNPFAPYESILTDEDIEKIRTYEAQYQWDKFDYAFVGSSGILASLTDYFLVSIPRTIKTGEYGGQVGSPITAWLKKYNINTSDDWFAQWAQHLEETCKVPYDGTNMPGMSPSSHRLQSLGHDPVLGFIFGVLDIMRGTITGFSYDKLSGEHSLFSDVTWSNNPQIGLIEAILRQIGHLISDAFTPMGLPAPFMTLVQGINIGSIGAEGKTVGEVARWMYLNGYDLRHFLVSGITPATIELVLRAYIMLRHYSEYGETKFLLGSHPKYRSMLLAAHSIAALGNVGKIILMEGNPLAINEAQWLALIRYTIPSVKYWVFEQHHLRLEYLNQMKESEWNMLVNNSDTILETVAQETDSLAMPGAGVAIALG